MNRIKRHHLAVPVLFLIAMTTGITGCSENNKAEETANKTVKAVTDKSAKEETKRSAENAMQEEITPLVTAQWLNQHLNDTNLVIFDTSVLVKMDESGYKTVSAQKEFDTAHIPNARFADLTGNLSKQGTDKPFILPSLEEFQKVVRELGVNNNSRVILYSSENESWPARVWWMLRWGGFNRASILNGGLNAWKESGFITTAEITPYEKGDFEFKLQPNLVAQSEQVLSSITDKSVTLIDSLSPGHYKGDFAMYSRPGHISGAINLPSSNFVDESGLFRAVDEIDMMVEVNKSSRTIAYCGGGVAASSVAFNLHRAGFTNVAVYMGSLQEWVENPSNPMTLGENP